MRKRSLPNSTAVLLRGGRDTKGVYAEESPGKNTVRRSRSLAKLEGKLSEKLNLPKP